MPTQPLPFVVLVLVLYVLTTARLTRILTSDRFTRRFRRWLTERYPAPEPDRPLPEGTPWPASWQAFLFHCPWCIGFWIALALAWPAAAQAGLPWWWSPALALSCSYAVGWLASREGL